MSNEKFIFSFLKEQNRFDLVNRLHVILSMARSRKDVLTKIIGLSDTLFQHTILYALFKKNSLDIPKSWKGEIQGYLDSIDAMNSGKNKKWLTATQIMSNLNDLLVPQTKRIVEKKLSNHSRTTQEKVKKSLEVFFKEPKLEKLVLLKYNNDDRLTFEFKI